MSCFQKWRQILILITSVYIATIYNTQCLPYLQYCAIIWAGSSNSIFKDILTIGLHKEQLEAFAKHKARTHWDPLFKILGVMKINDIYIQQMSIFMYE